MAGIGFRLQKLLSGESYTDLIKAYLYSSVIATGPMLVVILSLSVVRGAVQSFLSVEDGSLFMGLIIYCYAFSMIGVAPFLYVVTRYIADRYYQKQLDTFTPTYLASLQIATLVQVIPVAFFLHLLPLSNAAKWSVFCLYFFVSGIWIAMLFLSAARNYFWIFIAYLAGGLVGIGLALWLGHTDGIDGFIKGYAFGQGVVFFILTVRIFIEFGYDKGFDLGFLFYFQKYPYLVLVGLFYYLGIWADKFIFWFSSKGTAIVGRIYVFSDYDTPMFLAFLTIVPSMAFFLIQMETSFVKCYEAYFRSIRNRDGLAMIESCRSAIIENVSSNFQKFVLFQGILSGVVIIFIYQIADAFYLNPLQLGIFRIGILGAFLMMGFLMVLNILFYFDFQKEAFLLTLVFALCNAGFTALTLWIGLPAYGFGFATASFVALLAGFFLLDTKLNRLNYWTFMRQPILIPKFKFEAESK